MPENGNPPQRLIWIKTPKCAGTSVIQAISDLDLPISVVKWGLVSEFVRRESESLFRNAHKFAIVRNPFDRLVSSYHFCLKNGWLNNGMSFREFANMPWKDIENGPYPMGPVIMVNQVFQHTRPLVEHLSHDLERYDYVDEYIHFENLESELNQLLNRFSLPPVDLPNLNSTTRRKYQDYYDEETRRCVTEKFEKDLEFFNYRFDS